MGFRRRESFDYGHPVTVVNKISPSVLLNRLVWKNIIVSDEADDDIFLPAAITASDGIRI